MKRALHTEDGLPAVTEPTPAILKASALWKCAAASVASTSLAKHGAISSWLHDHAHRQKRGYKVSDQFTRFLSEMEAAGIPADTQDALLLDYVHGVRRLIPLPDRPAA